jgi:hypothetical protein
MRFSRRFAGLLAAGLGAGAALAGEAGPSPALFREGFDDPGFARRDWYDLGAIRLAGGSWAGAGCLEYEWPGPDSAVKGSAPMRHLFEPAGEVFVRFHLRLSAGWGWTGRTYHPHLVNLLTTENPAFHGPASSHLTLYIEPVAGRLRLAATDSQNEQAPHGLTQGPLRGGFNGVTWDSAAVLFTDDKWHCIEASFRLNTLDLKNDRPNADGVVRGWFDGKLVVEHTDVVLRTTDYPDMMINQLLLAPYFGPGLLPHPQKLWIDELAVGRTRLGPVPGTGP